MYVLNIFFVYNNVYSVKIKPKKEVTETTIAIFSIEL